MKVLRLYPLTINDLKQIIKNALVRCSEWNCELAQVKYTDEIIDIIASIANGDARQALNILETAFINMIAQNNFELTKETVKESAQTVFMNYDKTGEEHYNIISALHKSMRGSDINAAIYWCARMLEGGEDPLYICRRLIRMATEDIGVADTNALTVALNAYQTYTILGSPEGELAILEAVIYLTAAPKSNSVYTAYNSVKEFIAKDGYRPVPLHICNAPTKLMKDLGYSKNYKYPFNYKYNYVAEKYFPDEIAEQEFYNPSNFGFEKEIKKRIEFWLNLKSNNPDKKQ